MIPLIVILLALQQPKHWFVHSELSDIIGLESETPTAQDISREQTGTNLGSGVEKQVTRWQSGTDTPEAGSVAASSHSRLGSTDKPTEQSIRNQISPRQTCERRASPTQTPKISLAETWVRLQEEGAPWTEPPILKGNSTADRLKHDPE